jgi:hypothetical protein
MKNFSKIELAAIMDGLNNGMNYALVKGEYCTGFINAAGAYIHYQVAGSSAVAKDIKNLKWLLTDLFQEYDDITPAVYSYEIYNSVDLTGRYKSIDCSRYHKEEPATIYNGNYYFKMQ